MLNLLLLLSGLAWADVPPPTGTNYVDYYVEVEAPPTSGPHRLVVYPWSTSNGAPEARVGVVGADGRVELGRRIAGQPEFWRVPEGEVAAFEQMTDSKIREWFEAHPDLKCAGDAIRPRHTASALLGPNEIVDRFQLDAGDACALTHLNPPSESALPGVGGDASGSGCGCVTVSAVGVPGLLAFLGILGLRRRKVNSSSGV